MTHVPATVIVGAQWGDEGKGKIVDLLAQESDLVGRYQGGPNAGHTIVVDGERYALQLVPSGVLYDHVTPVIANGVVVDPVTLLDASWAGCDQRIPSARPLAHIPIGAGPQSRSKTV